MEHAARDRMAALLGGHAMHAVSSVQFEAGLADLVDFRVGDALELLSRGLGTVDFLLLDGAKPLYHQVLKIVEPSLRKGAVIAADNVNTRNKIEDFTGYIRDPKNGYVSVDMPLGDGIEVSLRV